MSSTYQAYSNRRESKPRSKRLQGLSVSSGSTASASSVTQGGSLLNELFEKAVFGEQTWIKAKFPLFSIGAIVAGGKSDGEIQRLTGVKIDGAETYVTITGNCANINLTGYLAGKSLGLEYVASNSIATTPNVTTFEGSAGTLAPSADTEKKIYLVPVQNSASPNLHDEYLAVKKNGSYSWELIGNTRIDLSGYQPLVQDLSTIRSNAAQGATAYGWGDHSNAGYITGITKNMVESVMTGDISSHTHSQYALASALTNYLPLTGGTITGDLIMSTGHPLKTAYNGTNYDLINLSYDNSDAYINIGRVDQSQLLAKGKSITLIARKSESDSSESEAMRIMFDGIYSNRNIAPYLSQAGLLTLGTSDSFWSNVYTKTLNLKDATGAHLPYIDVDSSGNVTVHGNLVATGCISAGGVATTASESIAKNLIPGTTDTYNLGSSAKKWDHAYIGTLHAGVIDDALELSGLQAIIEDGGRQSISLSSLGIDDAKVVAILNRQYRTIKWAYSSNDDEDEYAAIDAVITDTSLGRFSIRTYDGETVIFNYTTEGSITIAVS